MLTRTPIKRKSKKQPIVAQCDVLVRELVYARDGHACVRCGGKTALNPAHLLPKGKYPKMRFELLNILTMCWPCHRYHWHDDPVGAMRWLGQNYPDRWQQLLILDAIAKKPDLKELRIALQIEVKNLGG